MTTEIEFRLSDEGEPFAHFWRKVVGAGRANEGLRADWQEQLGFAKAAGGFEYLRFHGLFHDDMFVYREIDGKVVPNFQYIDLLFDAILKIGMRPFVEFGFMPSEIARHTRTVFWWGANGSPPTDYEKWSELVRATVEHWRGRYGSEEVRRWYYEVWNEPNLDPFFRGTKSEYFALYEATVNAVKSVDPSLRVGGPATSNFVPDDRFAGETENTAAHEMVLSADDLDSLKWKPVWLDDFMHFCSARKLPVDFVSCHPYPTDWALDSHNQGRKLTRGVEATPTDLRTLRAIVDASDYPAAEIHLTEWNSSSSPRDFTHDYLQAATFVVKANLESIGQVDSLAYWTFTDIFEESGGGQGPFHGGFGMLSQHGIPKPTMHAYRMMNALGNERLYQSEGSLLTRGSHQRSVSGMFYHYPPEVPLTAPASFDTRDVAENTIRLGSTRLLSLKLEGLREGDRYRLEIIDRKHGNAMDTWREGGSQDQLSISAVADLKAAASASLLLEYVVDDEGVLTIQTNLQPWSIALLTRTEDCLPLIRQSPEGYVSNEIRAT